MRQVFIFLLFLTSLPNILLAQKDSAKSGEGRVFDTSQLNNWKSQKVFQYERIKHQSLSIWDIISDWLGRFWRAIMENPTRQKGFWVILVILSAVLIIFIARRYAGNSSGIWSKSDKTNNGSYDWQEEDIHNIDFESQIAQALSQKNYRLAIRLRYLFLLKIFDTENYIRWQPGKTNYDYIKEVYQKSPEDAFPLFQKISFAYEYAWYGDHGATIADYDQANTLFESLKNNSFTKITSNERV